MSMYDLGTLSNIAIKNHSNTNHTLSQITHNDILDTPPEELTTTAFAQECHNLFQDEPNVSIEEIIGEELREKGYGGIYNVGKGAVEEPRLVILTYDPNKTGGDNQDQQASETSSNGNDDAESKDCIALIGKGIVYDTGGLAIKSKTGMCGMKSDMGGAAGVRE
jgi:probable aminopeptidase NPEPL1